MSAKREPRNAEPITATAVPVITFDGPSGSGKGTLSRAIAGETGYHLLDSGALYRLVALALLRQDVDPAAADSVKQAVAAARDLDVVFALAEDGGERVLLAGEDVTRAIRAEAVGNAASFVAARSEVRSALLARQRAFCAAPGLVADGRDMGTAVFPGAQLKLFVTASARERARRRHAQLSQAGYAAKIDRIYSEIVARDERDQARRHSPLRPADDASIVDTTGQSVPQTLADIRALLRERGLYRE